VIISRVFIIWSHTFNYSTRLVKEEEEKEEVGGVVTVEYN